MNLSTPVFKHQGLSVLPRLLEDLCGVATSCTARIDSPIPSDKVHIVLTALRGWLDVGQEIVVALDKHRVLVTPSLYRVLP